MNKTVLTEQEKELLNLYGEEFNDDDYEIIEIDDSEDLDDYDIYDEEVITTIKKAKDKKAAIEKMEKREEKEEEPIVSMGKNTKQESLEEIKPIKDLVSSYEEEKKEEYSTVDYFSEDEYEDEENYSTVNENKVEEKEVVVKEKKEKKKSKIWRILLIIILIALIMFAIDYIRVKKYDKLPLFAINLKTHKDGGTKEYYGAGYKVIDYHQIPGKTGKEIGSLFLKYNTKSLSLNIKDLATEVDKNEEKAFKKYSNKYIKTTAKLKSIEKELNEITLGYDDEDEKYTLDLVCAMAKKDQIEKLEVGKDATIVGTIKEFDYETGINPSTFFITDCFVEQ